MAKRLLCRRCRLVFDSTQEKETDCPACGSLDVAEAPAWAPLNSGSNIFEENTWKYECQDCRHTFEMPIPKSPTEQKNRKCPACGRSHLHILTNLGALPLYCG